MNYIRQYWEQIENGSVAVSRRVRQQYKILIDELDNPVDPWIFDEELAARPIDFIEKFCKQSKGKWIGQEIQLQLFQKAKFQAVFGFVHKDTKLRRCREVLTIEARKNGKSCEISGVGNFMLTSDGEGGPQVCCVASKRDQARIVFNEARNMVVQSPALSKFVKKRKSDLYCPFNFGTFEPLDVIN
jgi:phage terminase large subunit-like protein